MSVLKHLAETRGGKVAARNELNEGDEPTAALPIIGDLERITDHSTNVGERIWYMETGEMKELHE